MMMNPGKIITRSELLQGFHFNNMSAVDHFLDVVEEEFSMPWVSVEFIVNQRVLVFEKDTWNLFIELMHKIGYTYSPAVD